MIKAWHNYTHYEPGEEVHLNFEVVISVDRHIVVDLDAFKGHISRYIRFLLTTEDYEDHELLSSDGNNKDQ